MYLKIKAPNGKIYALPVAGSLHRGHQKHVLGLSLARWYVARKIARFVA